MSKSLYDKAKAWFESMTEADLDLLIEKGIMQREQVINLYLEENELDEKR